MATNQVPQIGVMSDNALHRVLSDDGWQQLTLFFFLVSFGQLL
jgi:hypothetical protein